MLAKLNPWVNVCDCPAWLKTMNVKFPVFVAASSANRPNSDTALAKVIVRGPWAIWVLRSKVSKTVWFPGKPKLLPDWTKKKPPSLNVAVFVELLLRRVSGDG